MSYQVGSYCYATPADAGTATCSRFSPVSVVSSAGTHIISTSCESVNAETGALLLRVATSEISSGAVSYQTVEQLPAYFPCQEQELWNFWLSLLPLALVAIIPLGTWYVIHKFMISHRGENT